MESQPEDSISNPVPSAACNLCGRVVSSDDVEIFSLCADCKFLLLEDFGTPAAPRRRRRGRGRRRSRHLSSEPVADHLITIARQTLSSEGDAASSHTTPTGSTRWRIFSESDSDNDSNASFSLYRFSHNDAVSFSDASTDRHVFLLPDDPSDIDIDFDFDTDIDPMHAALNHWNSDDEWEDGSGPSRPARASYLASPSDSYSSTTRFDSPDLDRGFRQRIIQRGQALSRNIFPGLEDMEFAANVGDYLDERGFEQLLEQLADSDNSRRGAPPASLSCVRNLPRVIIGEDHVSKAIVCAICKELFSLGNHTTQLPCLHLYHAHCIVPWLTARNSCPLCRYELPTDDLDYEEGKQNVLDVTQDMSSSDDDTQAGEEEYVERGEREARVSRGRWLFLAAAPVVSLVGVVLALWLSNPQRRDLLISHSQRGNRTRRWLPFF